MSLSVLFAFSLLFFFLVGLFYGVCKDGRRRRRRGFCAGYLGGAREEKIQQGGNIIESPQEREAEYSTALCCARHKVFFFTPVNDDLQREHRVL